MKIWQLCPPRELFSTETGGAVATVVAEVSRELVARGHDVTVAARDDGTPHPECGSSFASLGSVPWPESPLKTLRWKAETAVNRVFGWAWPAYASYLVLLRRRLRGSAVQPDVVITHNDPFVVRYLHRWAPSVPVVLWMHNEPHRLPRRRTAGDRAEMLVTVSDFLARASADRFGLPSDEIVVVHNGVDHVAFHPRPGFDQFRTPLQVLCLGRLGRNKGADVAFSAVRRLQDEGRDVELEVVGSPWFSPTPGVPVDPWGERFASELAAGGAVHIPHVPRDEVTALVRNHDVSCVLSRWDDPFPLVVLEAMASGCAVVATDRGGIPEAAGGVARLVRSDDPDAVAAILREYLSDPDSLAAAKRAAVAHAVTCTWGRATETFLAALREQGISGGNARDREDATDPGRRSRGAT
jgi:glycosyltransferase involved in cell wall biosynthesis